MADLEQTGQRLQQVGCALTLLVTLPILGLAFFGVLGLIVGLAIGLLFGVGMLAGKSDKSKA